MKPSDAKLYASVKRRANVKFLARTSAYKSAWIVREYKKRGGAYEGPAPSSSSGLRRWFREKWVDVSHHRGKNPPCGRSAATAATGSRQSYPLCRPTVRVTKATPATVQELSAAQIRRALKQKKALQDKGRAQFTTGRKVR
jgi:hypothetical protein